MIPSSGFVLILAIEYTVSTVNDSVRIVRKVLAHLSDLYQSKVIIY